MIGTLIFLVRQLLARMWGTAILAASEMPLVASGRVEIDGSWIVPVSSRLGICHRLLYTAPGRLVWMSNTPLALSWQSSLHTHANWRIARHAGRCRTLGLE